MKNFVPLSDRLLQALHTLNQTMFSLKIATGLVNRTGLLYRQFKEFHGA
jgi:hypothetical protein